MSNHSYTKSYLRRITGFEGQLKGDSLCTVKPYELCWAAATPLESMVGYAKIVTPLLVDPDLVKETYVSADLKNPVGFFRPGVLPGLSIDDAMDYIENDILDVVPSPVCLAGRRLLNDYSTSLAILYEHVTQYSIDDGFAGAWSAPGFLVAGYFSPKRHDVLVAVDTDARVVDQINARFARNQLAFWSAWHPMNN